MYDNKNYVDLHTLLFTVDIQFAISNASCMRLFRANKYNIYVWG